LPAKIVRSVSLTPELTALIDAKLASGHYRSASEVVRAALRLMDEQDRREGRRSAKRSPEARDAG
jgi:antitoxin ParD1/3/4